MGEGLAVEKKEIRNVSGSRGTKTRTNRDTYATTLRYIYDTRMTVVRHSCEHLTTFARMSLSFKNFGHVQIFRKPFATSSRLLRGYCESLRAVHDSFETSSRIESQNSREQSHASEIGAKPITMYI